MPLYAYECSTCGAEQDHFNRIAERHTNAPECHGPMQVAIQPNMGYVQRECHYVCPQTGAKVTSHKQRSEIMATHNLIDVNDMKPKAVMKHEQAERDRRASLGKKLTGKLSSRDLRPHVPAI